MIHVAIALPYFGVHFPVSGVLCDVAVMGVGNFATKWFLPGGLGLDMLQREYEQCDDRPELPLVL